MADLIVRYIEYSKLKKLLREDDVSSNAPREDREWTEQDEEDFVQELINVQLDKVNQFQVDTYKKLRDRTSECEARLEPLATSVNSGEAVQDGKKVAQEALNELDGITHDLNELQKYGRINFTGFLKAAKKHDRQRGSTYRIRPLLQVRLSELPFNSEDYSPLLYRLSTMYSFAHQMSDDETERKASSVSNQPRDSYTAHKFWVHEDNLLEVKTYILRRLPVLIYKPQSLKIIDSSRKDPTITSIYFDNPKFDLYMQKVEKAGEAGSLRLRWTGQLKDKPEIRLEKKVVGEAAESREIRIPIKEKYIDPFLRGEYHLEKQLQKLQNRYGVDSAQVKSLRSNIDEIQIFIQDHKLEPVLRASYTRSAFQIPGDDRIRISLDKDLALIREDALDVERPCREPGLWHRSDIDDNELEFPYPSIKKGEITRFPHALLEIKVKDSRATRNNAWLADLMSSHLIKEEPHFSKFVHGVAQLFEDHVNSFPFWLSDLGSDIRKDPVVAFQEEQERAARKAEDEFAVGSFLPGGSKLSSSPSFQPKHGSPHQFQTDNTAMKHSQSAQPRRRSQLDHTIREHDSTDEGVQGSKTPTENTGSSAGRLKGLLSGFSNSRYALRHRQGSARQDAALPPGVQVPGTWLKDSGPVRVEAKVWLANQRTFVKWQHIAVLLASLSLGLYNAAGPQNTVARILAVVYTGFAVFAGAWAWGVYLWRSRLIIERSGKDFDNVLGPVVVTVGLAVALILNFILKLRGRGSVSAADELRLLNESTWSIEL